MKSIFRILIRNLQ